MHARRSSDDESSATGVDARGWFERGSADLANRRARGSLARGEECGTRPSVRRALIIHQAVILHYRYRRPITVLQIQVHVVAGADVDVDCVSVDVERHAVEEVVERGWIEIELILHVIDRPYA